MRKLYWLTVLSAALLVGQSLSADTVLSGATTEPGSPPHFVMNAIAEAASEADGVSVRLEYPTILAMSQVDVAEGRLDFAVVPVITTLLMQRGLSLFRAVGPEKGRALADNLRAIASFNAGIYHVVTFADTGIDDWEDLKDKRIYVGTPNDQSSIMVGRLIRLVTGYKSGRDYKAIKKGWSEGIDGLIDGSIDVVIRPGATPADFIDRLVVDTNRKIRILGVPSKVAEGERFENFSTSPGFRPSFTQARFYDAERVEILNGGTTIAIMMAIVVNRKMDHSLVHSVTSRYIKNLDKLESREPWVESLVLQDPLTGLHIKSGLKLHSGARQAWQESGKTIPKHLR